MSSIESVSKKLDENPNLVDDILGAAVASITDASTASANFMNDNLCTLDV